MVPIFAHEVSDDRIMATSLGKSCFLEVLSPCPGLTGLFDDRIVTTLLGKSCLSILSAHMFIHEV